MTESLKAQRAKLARELCLATRHVGGNCFSCSALAHKLRELQKDAMEVLVESEQARYREAQRLAYEHGDGGCFWQYREWDRSLGQLDWLLDE